MVAGMEDEARSSQSSVDQMANATATNGSAINIILGSDALKPFAWFAGAVLAVALLISVAALGGSIYAVTAGNAQAAAAVDRANEEVHEANVNLRWVWYWLDTDYAEQLANGGHPPPLPKRPAFLKK